MHGPARGRHRREDVVARALVVLDEHGLDGLTMRRLAADLGVQPGAIYHHLPSKDALLAAIADELLERGRRAVEIVTWDAELRLAGAELRDAMLACRDGAALVQRVHALGLGAQEPERRMRAALVRAGADDALARVGARTLVHFVFGHVGEEQLPRDTDVAADGDFHTGLSLLLDGLAARLA